MIQIQAVESKKDWDAFIGMVWDIYGDDPIWVPPLRIAVRDALDPKKNPFFEHARMLPLIAVERTNGRERVVGRVVAVVDDNHNHYHQEQAAFFGFFECIDRQDVADALFEKVTSWAKAQGMTLLRGPINLSTNHECGLLVEGFENPPSVMMTYNPRYYEALLANLGFTKAKDLFAWELESKSDFSERLVKHANRLKEQGQVTFRSVDMKRFDQEVELILEIYNDAWEKNWGFVPMNPAEFRHMAKDMKAVVDPSLLLIAEVKGKPVGFSLTLPDVYQAQAKVRDGKLLPFGLAKLLWNLKGPGKKKTIDRLRILTLGVKRAYREAGIGPLLYMEYLRIARETGIRCGEASWILEDNVPMNRAIENMKGKRTKVYRIYDRPLG